MLTFLRKIRHNLIKTGSARKYALYAIGEIVLLVIGILIALQINNWNEDRLLKKEELKILISLQKEFNENLNKFDFSFGKTKEASDACLSIISANESQSIEELDSIFLKCGAPETYDQTKGIYNSIINSGKIELISNDILKLEIANFQETVDDYKETFPKITKHASYWIDYMIHSMEYNPLNLFRIRTEKQSEEDKTIFLEIIKTADFQSLMSMNLIYYNNISEDGEILRKELVSIVDLLESEIINLKG